MKSSAILCSLLESVLRIEGTAALGAVCSLLVGTKSRRMNTGSYTYS